MKSLLVIFLFISTSAFTQTYNKDTVKIPVEVARKVLKDLVELDFLKKENAILYKSISIKDSIISTLIDNSLIQKQQLLFKDSVVIACEINAKTQRDLIEEEQRNQKKKTLIRHLAYAGAILLTIFLIK